MTTPIRALAPPEIDLEGLAKILIEKERGNPTAIYRTRTEAMLEDNEKRAEELEAEIGALRRDNVAFETLISRMQDLLAKRKVFEADLAVELAVTHAAVAGLKQAGVTRQAAQAREGDEK